MPGWKKRAHGIVVRKEREREREIRGEAREGEGSFQVTRLF